MLKNGLHVMRTHLARMWGGASPGPLFVYLMATEACNLSCRFCDLWRTQHRNKASLANELTTSEMVRLVNELADMGCMIINLWGGEPLLRDDLCDIIRAISRAGMASVVTTNGLLLSEEKGRDLIAAGVNSVFVSIDSPIPAEHDELRGAEGAFDKAVAAVKRLRAIGGREISVGINTLVNRKNYQRLHDMMRLAASLSADSIRLLSMELGAPFSKYGSTDRGLFHFGDEELRGLRVQLQTAERAARTAGINCNLREYLRGMPAYYAKSYRPASCMAGDLICDIDAQGNVAPCLTMRGTGGNVKQHSFREIWRSPAFCRLRQDARRLRCPLCWQSCYIEPTLMASPFFLLSHLPHVARLWRLYQRR